MSLLVDDAQARAADPDHNAFVTANAGSGKTKTLIDRVARLLLAGAPPSAILCVTYTKAAAAEMQGRLFGLLGDWAVTSALTRPAAASRTWWWRRFSASSATSWTNTGTRARTS